MSGRRSPGAREAAAPASRVFGRRRVAISWALSVTLPILTTILLSAGADVLDRSSKLLGYTLVVGVVAAVGGVPPAVAAAVASSLLANWFFTPPVHTLTVGDPNHIVSLFVFVGVAVAIGFYVSRSARRSIEATRARNDARALASMSGAMGASNPLGTLLDQVCTVFQARSAAVFLRSESMDGWVLAEAVGPEVLAAPTAATKRITIGPRAVLAIDGDQLRSVDSDVLAAFGVTLGAALDRDELHRQAARAERLSEADALRTGLLNSISHDLRTPLTGIKAAASTLAHDGADWTPDVVHELSVDIDEQSDRLISIVENLLSMSRIQAGAVRLELTDIDVAEVVTAALGLLGAEDDRVRIDLGDAPPVLADGRLLERAIGNLIDNALKWSPTGAEVAVRCEAAGEFVAIVVSDHGPGIPADRRGAVFSPFQRVHDAAGPEGTGLGMAIASGFVASMGGSVELGDTPGGGLTVRVLVPASRAKEAVAR